MKENTLKNILITSIDTLEYIDITCFNNNNLNLILKVVTQIFKNQ